MKNARGTEIGKSNVQRTADRSRAKLAEKIAKQTSDAYMADSYGKSWTRCALILLGYQLTRAEVAAVLRSKYMRWADDSFGRGAGKGCNSAAFKQFIECMINRSGIEAWAREIHALAISTFGYDYNRLSIDQL